MSLANALQVTPTSATRLRVVLDSSLNLSQLTQAGNWSVVRQDGAGGNVPSVTFAFQVDSLAVELVLAPSALPSVAYLLASAYLGNTPLFRFAPPSPDFAGQSSPEDPEAEAFGVDWDWLAPALDGTGDLPVVSGRACLQHDLAAIAVTERGELFHRPTEGAGMRSKVNGVASTPEALDDVTRSLKQQWLTDARVTSVSIETTADASGNVIANAKVQPIALDQTLDVIARAG